MNAPGDAFDETYFREFYPDYERQNPPRKMAFYRMLAERAVGSLERPRLLDLGCAFGKFLATLDPAWRLYGLDVSEFAVAAARLAVPHASFAVSTATDPPFETDFDLVTAFDVIEHVEAVDRLLAAVHRRLVAGGHFLFVVPVYDGITGPLIRLLDRDVTHVHRWSRSAWHRRVEERFEVVEWWGIYRYLLPGGPYVHWPTRALRSATPAIAVLTRRREDAPREQAARDARNA